MLIKMVFIKALNYINSSTPSPFLIRGREVNEFYLSPSKGGNPGNHKKGIRVWYIGGSF